MTGFRNDMVMWVAKVTNRLVEVPAEATKLLIEDVRIPVSQGGNMPVRYGNLRNSLEVSLTGMPSADREYPEAPVERDPTARNNSVLERSRIGALISIGFRAIYGPKMELRNAFVRLSAQKWDQFVNTAVTRIAKKGGP